MAAQKHESKYKAEDNWGETKDCEPPEFEGDKASSRPATFCKPVTALDSLTAVGPTTLNQTTIVPPAITVGGQTFVPMQVPLCIGIAPGGPPARVGEEPAGPTPIMQTFTLLVAAAPIG